MDSKRMNDFHHLVTYLLSFLESLSSHFKLIYNYFAIFSPDTGNKKSKEVVNNLAKVDDFCTKLDIGLVKINDLELVTEYNLGELPALVYYRHGIPILYEGELSRRLKMEG